MRSLGQLDTVHTLLKALADARPRSPAVRDSYFEAVMVKAKTLMDRCSWTEAELLLRPMAAVNGVSRATQIASVQSPRLLRCRDAGLRRRHPPFLAPP